ncbi:Apoptosis-inducing factor 2 [Rhodotorula toruloides]|nr:Apoptosis-inducing factor 2 [Rhodotorula toruloides]
MKNVVFVGYGPSAVQAAKDLAGSLPADYRIVAITLNEGYWPPAALRAAVVPGWEDKPLATVDAAFPQDDRHVMLKMTNVVELRKNSVVIDKAHPDLGFEGEEIPFEYCVLAMGSKYPYPCRPHPSSSFSQTLADLRQTQLEVSQSHHILIIGGGPVGIEFAGEVAAHYGKGRKEITLVHSRERLLDQAGWKEKLGKSLEGQLEGYGVRVVMGRKVVDVPEKTGRIEGGEEFHLDDGQKIKADFVFLATGNAPNSDLVASFDPSVLDDSKHIKVNPAFQVEGYEHIFAMGDVTDVKEGKQFAHAKNHGSVVASNILSLIHSPSPSSASLKSYKPGSNLILVSVGPWGGAGQIFGFVPGAWFSALVKSRSLFVSDFKKMYNVA